MLEECNLETTLDILRFP